MATLTNEEAYQLSRGGDTENFREMQKPTVVDYDLDWLFVEKIVSRKSDGKMFLFTWDEVRIPSNERDDYETWFLTPIQWPVMSVEPVYELLEPDEDNAKGRWKVP